MTPSQHRDRIRAFASVHAALAAAPSGDCRHEKECFCAIRVADALMPECTNDEWAAAKVAASALLRVGLSGRQ